MKVTIVLALAALSSGLVSPQARAQGEGNTEPFRFSAPVQFTAGSPLVTDNGAETYPQLNGRAIQPSSLVELAPAVGSEAIVQTVNSLPQGFFQQSRVRYGTVLVNR